MARSLQALLAVGGLLLLVLQVSLAATADEYMSFDGKGNNLVNPTYGVIGSPTIRSTFRPLSYTIDSTGKPQPWAGPNPRLISNSIFASAIIDEPTDRLNVIHSGFSQMISHDMARPNTNATDRRRIPIPRGDRFFDPFTEGTKVMQYSATIMSAPNVVPSRFTPYMDAAIVYGHSEQICRALRNTTDPAKLRNSLHPSGEIFPSKNTDNNTVSGAGVAVPLNELYFLGDPAANQNPALFALHVIFNREHNRLVDEMRLKHPTWDADKLFFEVRRWVVAFFQNIVFSEYAVATLGKPLPPYKYDPNLEPVVETNFITAGMRYGHSTLPSMYQRINASGRNLKPILLRDTFFDPRVYSDGVNCVLRGLVQQAAGKTDNVLIDDMRNFLNGRPNGNPAAIDIVSISIARGRDEGAPFLNDAREALGLPRYTSFDQITSKPAVAAALKSVYNDTIENVDFYIGVIEEHVPNGAMGPTFTELMYMQLARIRDADRYYFENPDAGFTPEEVAIIANTTLGQLIMRNSDVIIKCPTFFATSPECESTNITSSSASALGGNYVFSWSLNNDDKTVTFNVTAKTTGWVGIGISRSGGMLESDVWIGTVVNGVASVVDSDITINRRPCVSNNGVCSDTNRGGRDDITNVSGFEANGVTSIRFTRAFDTGDAMDIVIDPSKTITMIVAMGDTDVVAPHLDNRAVVRVNLQASTFEVSTYEPWFDRLTVHGIMMFFCWAVMFPAGVFVARFLRHTKLLLRWWFHLHLLIQYLGVLFLFAGFILAVEAVTASGHSHFTGAHKIMGLVTFLLGVVVPAFGQVTAMFWTADSGSSKLSLFGTRLFPEGAHFISGYLSILFSFFTLYWGLSEHDSEWWWYLLLTLWLGFVILAFVIGFIIQIVVSCLGNSDEPDTKGDKAAPPAAEESWDDSQASQPPAHDDR